MSTVQKIIREIRRGDPKRLFERVNSNVGLVPSSGTRTGRTCLRPFYHMTVQSNGKVYCCCPGWVKFRLGNLDSGDALVRLWNGRIARAFREAMISTELDRVCRVEVCPYIIDGSLPSLTDGQIDFGEFEEHVRSGDMHSDGEIIGAVTSGATRLDYLPRSLEIAADERCNLACPTCRSDFITEIPPKNEQLLDLLRENLDALAPELRYLQMLGSGEVFYSPFTLGILQSLTRKRYPNLSVRILTNGQLLTERMWEKLGEGAEFISDISVSIDAATEASYREIRKGGDWSRLLRNLEFMRTLRASGSLKMTSINFVVSAENFREIPDFIRMGERFEVDKVMFTAVQPWDGMGVEYAQAAVHLDGHPEHDKFRAILEDPICDSDRVVMGVSA